MRYFIRSKDAEAFVEAETMAQAFVRFVEEIPLEQLGLLLLGAEEYFLSPLADVKAIRTTIPLVQARLWTEEQAMDFNEQLCGIRFI